MNVLPSALLSQLAAISGTTFRLPSSRTSPPKIWKIYIAEEASAAVAGSRVMGPLSARFRVPWPLVGDAGLTGDIGAGDGDGEGAPGVDGAGAGDGDGGLSGAVPPPTQDVTRNASKTKPSTAGATRRPAIWKKG